MSPRLLLYTSLLPRQSKKIRAGKIRDCDGYFNVRNLKSFYSPTGPGIKHLSTKGATDGKCPILYISVD